LATLANVAAEPGVVSLTWYSNIGTSGPTVYRRTPALDWQDLGQATTDASGLLTYVDHSVTEGRYAYRLGFDGRFTAETWVNVPAGYSLTLEGLRPNPGTSTSKIAFSLADSSPATLEIYTIAGRLVAQESVGSFGAGNHVVDLARSASLGAGVYWIRLTQSAKSMTTKGIIIQ
jgi:hypothetical protein